MLMLLLLGVNVVQWERMLPRVEMDRRVVPRVWGTCCGVEERGGLVFGEGSSVLDGDGHGDWDLHVVCVRLGGVEVVEGGLVNGGRGVVLKATLWRELGGGFLKCGRVAWHRRSFDVVVVVELEEGERSGGFGVRLGGLEERDELRLAFTNDVDESLFEAVFKRLRLFFDGDFEGAADEAGEFEPREFLESSDIGGLASLTAVDTGLVLDVLTEVRVCPERHKCTTTYTAMACPRRCHQGTRSCKRPSICLPRFDTPGFASYSLASAPDPYRSLQEAPDP